MTTSKRLFNLALFTEDKIGLLSRITGVLTRRHVSIESLIASESELRGIYRFNIVIHAEPDLAYKIAKQIEKLIEVIKVWVYEEDEIIYEEIALYKVPTEELTQSDKIERLVREHSARIMYVGPEIMVIEKTGHYDETQQLFRELEPFGILEFSRSGRIAISKSPENLHSHLQELEQSTNPLITNVVNNGKN